MIRTLREMMPTQRKTVRLCWRHSYSDTPDCDEDHAKRVQQLSDVAESHASVLGPCSACWICRHRPSLAMW